VNPMNDIKEFETKLHSLRSELTQRIEAIHKDTHHTEEPVEKDFAEQATQSENDDVLNALDNEAQQTVNMIDQALVRITEGSYGLCESCGEAINERRLEVVPYASLCIKCAEEQSID